MKDSEKQRIQNQFGAFCIKVLKNETRCIQREYAKSQKLEKSLNDLTELGIFQLATCDEYFKNDHIFEVQRIPIVVNSDFLAQAISQLPAQKRDIILLSYFLGLSDKEIGERLQLVRRTICKHRLKALNELRKNLLKEGYEWSDV